MKEAGIRVSEIVKNYIRNRAIVDGDIEGVALDEMELGEACGTTGKGKYVKFWCGEEDKRRCSQKRWTGDWKEIDTTMENQWQTYIQKWMKKVAIRDWSREKKLTENRYTPS